ncbi:unnamed protein product [Arctogadus glacialis]
MYCRVDATVPILRIWRDEGAELWQDFRLSRRAMNSLQRLLDRGQDHGAGGVAHCMFGNLNTHPFTREAMTTGQLTIEASEQISRDELRGLLEQPTGLRGQTWWAQYTAGNAQVPWKNATGAWTAGTGLDVMLNHVHTAANRNGEQIRNRVLYIVLLAIVSSALRGDVSNAKLARMQADLRTAMPFVGNLSREDILRTWTNYGHLVDEVSAGEVITHLMTCIPGGCVRLRVCLAQAAGSGMSSLDTVAGAFREHPDFPSQAVQKMYPNDFAGAYKALHIVAGNPHYGYKNELGAVSSTNYRSLAWVCGLLIVATGDPSLKEYKGFKEDSRNKSTITDMIASYVAHSGASVDMSTPYTAVEHSDEEVLPCRPVVFSRLGPGAKVRPGRESRSALGSYMGHIPPAIRPSLRFSYIALTWV